MVNPSDPSPAIYFKRQELRTAIKMTHLLGIRDKELLVEDEHGTVDIIFPGTSLTNLVKIMKIGNVV